MTVDVSDPSPWPIDVEAVRTFAMTTLEREGVDESAILSIAFVSNEEIARLNEEHMGRRGPTDVLSFPIEDASPDHPPARREGDAPLHLGDIVIAAGIVDDHARAFEVSFEDELFLMVCHGVLHILGWDHQTDAEAEAMERREAEHLAAMGRVRR